MGKIIGFKGHKNVLCDESVLVDIANKAKGATWVFGDNTGFDQQALEFSTKNNIPYTMIASQRDLGAEQASFVRNRAIVDCCDELVVFYDGRTGGEVWFTVMYAEGQKKPMTVFKIKKVNSGNWLPGLVDWKQW
jgi:hypothetical protein